MHSLDTFGRVFSEDHQEGVVLIGPKSEGCVRLNLVVRLRHAGGTHVRPHPSFLLPVPADICSQPIPVRPPLD